MSIKNVLIDEFNSELKEIGKMEVGTEKHKTAVDGVTKLADRIIEIKKLEQEASIKEISRMDENELKAAQLASDKRDRLIKNCLTGVNIAGGFGLAVWAFVASMKYEEKGVMPSTEGGRAALRSLFKFMK